MAPTSSLITPTKSSFLVLLLALFMYSTSAILPGVSLPGLPLPRVPLPGLPLPGVPPPGVPPPGVPPPVVPPPGVSPCGVPQQTNFTSLYFRTNFVGPNTTAVTVAGIAGNRWSPADFATVYVIDQIITETPDPNAPIIARGQGIYVVASVDVMTAFTTYAVVFKTGPYAGSTLELHGSFVQAAPSNELAVSSGTGRFRCAKGYAVFITLEFDAVVALFRVDMFVQT